MDGGENFDQPELGGLEIEQEVGISASQRTTADERGVGHGASSRRRRSSPPRPTAQTTSDGADLERRVARLEFAEGALARLRVPVRVDAEAGRAILTDIDVLAIDIDGRLRVSRSILECKSGRGQSGEPDRLLWLAGLQRFVGAERAVLVRQTVSRRGRHVAAELGLRILDVETLRAREEGHGWIPQRFAHVDGEICALAETRTDSQLKGLSHIPSELVAFLRYDAVRSDSARCLSSLGALRTALAAGGVLPQPAGMVIASHALMTLLIAAIQDAGTLDEVSSADLRARTQLTMTVGSPDNAHVLGVLEKADEVLNLIVERVHQSYARSGSGRQDVPPISLRQLVTDPPPWLDRYVDLGERLRANPAVARELLQTAELALFEGLLGGSAHTQPAFDHLFTVEHRYLLNAALRCLDAVVGSNLAASLRPALELDFDRRAGIVPDRTGRDTSASQTPPRPVKDPEQPAK
ncbi:hypothetical protein [Kribbella monticola]|uniref:hypothetical protein n=1 Tax=Kribbella monticola TaxID=2185285 RepID=UPI001300B399|nr:hypothetical protein [Kribbella monticola]